MSSNTYGRQVVIPMTNGSGGGVIAGDVVIVNTGANLSFTTTTSAGFTGMVGVAQETIANAAVGRVLLSGYAALINVNASVTRGNFGKTFTVAKQASDAGSTRGTGTFCQFLTGGTTPDAVVYPVDLLGSSLTNPMTTKGDMIQADTGGTPIRTAASTAGFVWTAGGAGAFSAWAAPAASAAYGQTYSYPTTFTGDTINGSSATPFVDVSAFDTKEVLNSRILHLQTLGASKDQKVRVTLGTTKAGAFDVTVCMAFGGAFWSATTGDTYLGVQLTTAAGAAIIAIQRIIPVRVMTTPTTPFGNFDALRPGSATISTTDTVYEPKFPWSTPATVRFVRDGSNVISYFYGFGTAPMALAPMLKQADDALYTNTVSGTLACIEFTIHTPAGPGAGAQWDAYIDWLASV